MEGSDYVLWEFGETSLTLVVLKMHVLLWPHPSTSRFASLSVPFPSSLSSHFALLLEERQADHGLRCIRCFAAPYLQTGNTTTCLTFLTLFLTHLAFVFLQTQGDAWFKPSAENIHAGVCLRIQTGQYRVFPYENRFLEPFEAAVRVLNPVVAVKVRSAAVHVALSTV